MWCCIYYNANGMTYKKCFYNKITFVIYVRVHVRSCLYFVVIYTWFNLARIWELTKLILIAAFHKKWPIDLRLLMWCKAILMDTYIYSNSTIRHPNRLYINIQHAIKSIPVISKVCTKKVPFEMVPMWWNETEHKQGES